MAERKRFLDIQYISDHSCGTYQVGEIDTMSNDAVYEHIRVFGEYGYTEIRDFAIRMIVNAEAEIRRYRGTQAGCGMAAFDGVVTSRTERESED